MQKISIFTAIAHLCNRLFLCFLRRNFCVVIGKSHSSLHRAFSYLSSHNTSRSPALLNVRADLQLIARSVLPTVVFGRKRIFAHALIPAKKYGGKFGSKLPIYELNINIPTSQKQKNEHQKTAEKTLQYLLMLTLAPHFHRWEDCSLSILRTLSFKKIIA